MPEYIAVGLLCISHPLHADEQPCGSSPAWLRLLLDPCSPMVSVTQPLVSYTYHWGMRIFRHFNTTFFLSYIRAPFPDMALKTLRPNTLVRLPTSVLTPSDFTSQHFFSADIEKQNGFQSLINFSPSPFCISTEHTDLKLNFKKLDLIKPQSQTISPRMLILLISSMVEDRH